MSIGLLPIFEASPLERFLLCRHRALLGCFLGEPWRRAGPVVSHWWKQHWCSWWTEGSFSRLLSSLGTLVGKECYLRAFFIQHEAQGPLTFSRGVHVCLAAQSTSDHSLLPEMFSSFDATLSWFCSQLTVLFCFPSVSPAWSFSSYFWPLNFEVPGGLCSLNSSPSHSLLRWPYSFPGPSIPSIYRWLPHTYFQSLALAFQLLV